MILNLDAEFSARKARALLEKYIAAGYKIELRRILPKRTLSQNAYLHSLISILAIEIGHSLYEMKQIIKLTCPFMHYEKDGITFLKQTSKLDTKDMTALIDWMRNYYAMQGIYLPSPDDFHRDYDEIQNLINQNREFL